MTDLLSSDPNAEPSPPPAVIAPAADASVQPYKITGAMTPAGPGPLVLSIAPKVSLIPPDPVREPDGNVLAAAFRQGNPIVSAFANQEVKDGAPDPNFNSIEDIIGTKYAPYASRFAAGAFNRAQSSALKAQIDQEVEDRRTLDGGGLGGFLASLTAGALDPTMLLPVGEFYKGTKLGLGAVKQGLRVGAGFAAATSVSELALQATQETRPVSQSLFTIGGSALLGGLLGSAASPIGRAFGREVRTRLADGLDKVANRIDPIDTFAENATREGALFEKGRQGTLTEEDLNAFEHDLELSVTHEPGSAGAAAVEGPSLEGEGIYGKVARHVAEQTRLISTNLRLATSRSANTRALDMLDFPVYKEKNVALNPEDVRKSNQDLENSIKLTDGKQYQGEANHNLQDGKYRLVGGTLSWKDFNIEVGKALEEGDIHAIPEVQNAAEGWRRHLYDPTKDEAIELKGLPSDVKVTEAKSYFHINYDQKKIIANPDGWRTVITPHFEGIVRARIADEAARRDEAFARIDAEIADLQASPEETQKLLATLPLAKGETVARGAPGSLGEQAAILKAANPQHVATDMALQQLRAKAADALAEAKAAPGTSTAALKNQEAIAHTVEVKRIATEAGQDYASFVAHRNAIAARQSRLRGNLVSLADKTEKARGQLADIEQANIERFRALHTRLTNLKAEMERAPSLDFENRKSDSVAGNAETHAEMVTRLETDFNQAMARTTAAQDRLARATEKADLEDQAAHFEGAPPKSALPLDFAGILKEARAPAPVVPPHDAFPGLRRLIGAGGVRPNSPLAQELRAAGVTADSIKEAAGGAAKARELGLNKVFNNEGIKHADNLDSANSFFEWRQEGDPRYLDPDKLITAIKDEMVGEPHVDAKIAEAKQAVKYHEDTVAHFRNELERMGVDLDKMSNDEVMNHLSKLQEEHNTLHEQVPPATSEHGGAVAPEIVTRSQAQIRAGMAARQRIFDAVDHEATKVMTKKAEQLEELHGLDPGARTDALLQMSEEAIQHAAQVVGRADDFMARISGRLKASNPKVAEAKIAALKTERAAADSKYGDAVDMGMNFAGDSKANFDAYVRSIVDHVTDRLTGVAKMGGNPFRIDPVLTGPMAQRTLHIPQELTRDFREMDAVKNGRVYARKMGPMLAVLRRYGSPDMRDQLEAIAQDWVKLKAAVPAGPGSEAAQLALDHAQKTEYDHITNRRDQLLGVNRPDDNTPFARLLDSAGGLAYAAHFGGMLVSALSDPARMILHEGLGHFMSAGILPLIQNFRALKMSQAEGRAMGAILETAKSGRLANVSELTNPLARRGTFENGVKWLAEASTKMSGITWWDDWMKTIAHRMATTKMIEGVTNYGSASVEHRAWMAMLGIDQEGASRIAAQFAKHGNVDGGLVMPRWEEWGKGEAPGSSALGQAATAKREYGIAINKAVAGPTPSSFSIGDRSLFGTTAAGRAMTFGQNFMLASHTRMTIRGLQEGPANVISAMMAATTAGMFIYWLKAVESNKVAQLSDNPGHWLMQGIDNSSMVPLFFTVNNVIERALGVGAYGAGQALFPGKSQKENVSRSGVASAALGPAGDYIDGLQKALQGVSAALATSKTDPTKRRGLTDSEIKTFRSLVPLSTVPGVRSILDYGVVPWASKHFANPPPGASP